VIWAGESTYREKWSLTLAHSCEDGRARASGSQDVAGVDWEY